VEVLLYGIEFGCGLKCLGACGMEGEVRRIGAGILGGLFYGDLVW
jgi:hypothetical protein